MRVEVPPGIIVTRVERQAFAIVVDSGEIHELNAVAADLVDLCAEPADLSDVVEGLAATYKDVGRDELARDVRAAVDDFIGRGILRPAQPRP